MDAKVESRLSLCKRAGMGVSYHRQLLTGQKEGKTIWRSIRLAMTPAAELLIQASAQGVCPPDQKMLDAYLDKTPGQRAAVAGFVRHLRDGHEVNITLTPTNDKAKIAKKKRLENELLRLLLVENERGQLGRLKLLAVAMAYFHGVAQKDITVEVMEGVVATNDGDGGVVTISKTTYWLPRNFIRESLVINAKTEQ
jgi:hypothetical protein